jgi:hypothetical protein
VSISIYLASIVCRPKRPNSISFAIHFGIGPVPHFSMKTIEEIRHDWLLRLVKNYGTVADLNIALGRTRTDAYLTLIKNKVPNTRTGGKIRSMGSDLAREIESTLKMERGTLDHEPGDAAITVKDGAWAAYDGTDDATKALVDAILGVGKQPPWLDTSAVGFIRLMKQAAQNWLSERKKKTA